MFYVAILFSLLLTGLVIKCNLLFNCFEPQAKFSGNSLSSDRSHRKGSPALKDREERKGTEGTVNQLRNTVFEGNTFVAIRGRKARLQPLTVSAQPLASTSIVNPRRIRP
jgi:hypothetical protein